MPMLWEVYKNCTFTKLGGPTNKNFSDFNINFPCIVCQMLKSLTLEKNINLNFFVNLFTNPLYILLFFISGNKFTEECPL